jgi:hypothetical protein
VQSLSARRIRAVTTAASKSWSLDKIMNACLHNSRSTGETENTETANFTSADEFYISIESKADTKAYVSAFRVDAAGNITPISRQWETGLDLSPYRPTYTFAINNFPLEGIPLRWPRSVPQQESVKEQFFIVVTREEMDLRCLETLPPEEYLVSRGRRQKLVHRTMTPYNVIHIPYVLHWAQQEDENGDFDAPRIASANLPAPEETPEGHALSSESMKVEAVSRGAVGRLYRTLKGVEPYVWVVNQHSEEITVVVSKYAPNRMLTEVGFNASATGGGLNFSSSVSQRSIFCSAVPRLIWRQ